MLKPIILKTGDTIGLVSPSSGMARQVPHRVERAQAMFRQMGFHVKVGPNALKTSGYTAGTPEERAADLNQFFADPEVSAIVSFIGGNHSNQLLRYLDFEMIRANPKVFVGYSDITVLHLALYTQAQLITFYGPAALTQFAESPEILSYTRRHFERALMQPEPIGVIEPSTEWTDEVLNWFERQDLERPRQMKPNPGYVWLRQGVANGPILGGCISSLAHLRGTQYWPDFSGSIFFWEIPESDDDFRRGEPLGNIDAILTDLDLSGVFAQIVGMVIGRPYGCTTEEVQQLRQVILERTKDYSFPILFGVDIGHTDPMVTVPLGVEGRLDSSKNKFLITESGVII